MLECGEATGSMPVTTPSCGRDCSSVDRGCGSDARRPAVPRRTKVKMTNQRPWLRLGRAAAGGPWLELRS